jgi:transcription initiation factor IIE alpha subunit
VPNFKDWPQRNPHVHYWHLGKRKYGRDPGNYYEFFCPWCGSKLVRSTKHHMYPTEGDLEFNHIKKDCAEQLVSIVMLT